MVSHAWFRPFVRLFFEHGPGGQSAIRRQIQEWRVRRRLNNSPQNRPCCKPSPLVFLYPHCTQSSSRGCRPQGISIRKKVVPGLAANKSSTRVAKQTGIRRFIGFRFLKHRPLPLFSFCSFLNILRFFQPSHNVFLAIFPHTHHHICGWNHGTIALPSFCSAPASSRF